MLLRSADNKREENTHYEAGMGRDVVLAAIALVIDILIQ
jgi:hypothetical protein